MSARHLVIGLDGADLEVIFTFGRDLLPSIFSVMEAGVYAPLQSVQPPATLPNWTTFLTGKDPGYHGVFDFTTRRGYGVRFTAGTVREEETWLRRLDRDGSRCACVGFPGTWPPEPFENGIFISGWDAPVAFEADRSFVWPSSLHDALTARFGALSFDDVDEFAAEKPGWHASLGARLSARVARRTELASFLLQRERWDVFAFYFGESDTASHHLWSLHDEGSPRHPVDADEESKAGLKRVYQALDRAVGRLLDEAGEGAEVTLVSDHGSGGSSDKVLYLNRALAGAGLLRFEPAGGVGGFDQHLKQWALTKLSPRLRERIFRWGGAALPSWLESRARFGRIDMSGTLAFSDELNYFPGIHLNLEGREPDGQVAPAELDDVRARVREALMDLRDPWSGRRVVRAVHPRESVFSGPWLRRAPDLLIDFELDRGYSYNLMPTPAQTPDGPTFERLPPAEYLGRKGRSLPGSHRPRGFFAAAGPAVHPLGQIDLAMADAAALTVARLGARTDRHGGGRVPSQVLNQGAATRPLAARRTVDRAAGHRADEARVEARLRALGYID